LQKQAQRVSIATEKRVFGYLVKQIWRYARRCSMGIPDAVSLNLETGVEEL